MYALTRDYYSDCPCDYCTGRRVQDGAQHYNRPAPSNWR